MPTGPAARLTDLVSHPLPPMLTGGPGSPSVLIGFMPAWRGLPLAAVGALQAAKTASDIVVHTAEAVTAAATAGTPGAPAAYAAEQTAKGIALAAMSAAINSAAAAGSDVHMCLTPSPVPPHTRALIDSSATVMIMNMPACRMGDTLLEALGPPNKIVGGLPTVIIGG